jgi:hypothetical protein
MFWMVAGLINRHRWAATGLSILFVGGLAVGFAGFIVYQRESAPEPWPPEYRVDSSMEDPGTCSYPSVEEGVCYAVFTAATSKKALTYITKAVAAGRYKRSVDDVDVMFYPSPENPGDFMFSQGSFTSHPGGGDVSIRMAEDNSRWW